MTPEEQQGDWIHHEAIVNGLRLHYVEAGAGPLVVLLHGFPEFWYSWRHQIPALADAGFRVIVPDMRGYNLSERPPGVASYGLEHLTADVAALIHHAGEENAIVVGHDWGGAIAWATAMQHPHVVHKLIILNAPHPAAFFRELRTGEQLRRSWYMLLFQIPWLPESLARLTNYAVFDATFRHDPVRPGAFSDDDIRRYKEAIARPGALTASINYYRALFRESIRHPLRPVGQDQPIDAPTLIIWGEGDRYLGLRLLDGLEQWVSHLRIERIANASHWVQVDAPDRVNDLIVQFARDEA